MNYEDQFASMYLCEKLQSLGISQDTLFVWVCIEYADKPPAYAIVPTENLHRYSKEHMRIICAAYTVGELGYLLPELCSSYCDANGKWCAHPSALITVPPVYDQDTEANARALLLIEIHESTTTYSETDQFTEEDDFDIIET